LSTPADRLRRVLFGIGLGLVLGYGGVLGALYLSQSSLIYPAPQLSAGPPQGYRQVRYSTADGLTLSALYRAPAAGKRTVVFFHGNGDSWEGAAAANRLPAEAGYGVLLVEYRGYGSNPGKPTEQGLYADGRAALAWLKSDQGTDAGQIVLVGNSLGSGTATQLATETQVAGLAIISGFMSLPQVVADKLPWVPARLLTRDTYDNQAKMSSVRAPVLLLHGLGDTMIGPAHARALARAKPDAKLVLVPGFGHELAYSDASQLALLGWLNRLK
jgi:uncharacterized protein